MIQVVVLLKIKDTTTFADYEHQAITVMAEYGGKLISAFSVDATNSTDTTYQETHILEFPSIQAFTDYRQSSKIQDLRSLREQAIESTAVYVSEGFKQYGALKN